VTERQWKTGFALGRGAFELGEHLGHSRLRLSPVRGLCEFDPMVLVKVNDLHTSTPLGFMTTEPF
jgi:hypothetical protein